MKKKACLFLLYNSLFFCSLFVLNDNNNGMQKKCFVADRIVTRVNGINILQSDLSKKRISKEGGRYSLKEVIFETLCMQRASEKHLLPTKQDIDRQILAFKNANGLAKVDDDKFQEMLKDSGFSLSEYKRQLGYVLASENLKRIEVNERVFITGQDVREYYEKKIPRTNEKYFLKLAFLEEEQVPIYKDLIRQGKVSWNNPCWLEKDEIDKSYFNSLVHMKKGQISKVIACKRGFAVLHFLDYEPSVEKSFDDAYKEIERILQVEKRSVLLRRFEESILNQADIVFL